MKETLEVLLDAKKTDVEKAEEADAEILAAIASRRKLASDLELAKGVQYMQSLQTRYVSFALSYDYEVKFSFKLETPKICPRSNRGAAPTFAR